MNAARTSRPGRPRRAETDAAINAATRELLAEVGYGDLTIEAVAQRAGVSRPTVYRRHDSKATLVAAALSDTLESINPSAPDTGDVNGDLRVLLGNLAEVLTSTDFGAGIVEIVTPAARDDDLAELFTSAVAERRLVIRAVLGRAAETGRLVSADVETAIDMALGAIYFRHLFSHGPLDRDFIAGLADAVVRDRQD